MPVRKVSDSCEIRDSAPDDVKAKDLEPFSSEHKKADSTHLCARERLDGRFDLKTLEAWARKVRKVSVRPGDRGRKRSRPRRTSPSQGIWRR